MRARGYSMYYITSDEGYSMHYISFSIHTFRMSRMHSNLIPLFCYIPGCPFKGQQFNRCGSACPPTCTNPNPICTLQCVPHCQYPRGKVLDKRRKKCVFLFQCFHWTTWVFISDIDMCIWLQVWLIELLLHNTKCVDIMSTYHLCSPVPMHAWSSPAFWLHYAWKFGEKPLNEATYHYLAANVSNNYSGWIRHRFWECWDLCNSTCTWVVVSIQCWL